jgi:cytoskeleton protein RodZ
VSRTGDAVRGAAAFDLAASASLSRFDGAQFVLQDRKSRLMQVRSMMSSVVGGTATRAGADIREARERLGWDLPAVAAHLRIRLAYLEAIEDGRIDDLPGNAYAIGFLRTYAQALGLDPDEVVRRFREEASQVNRRTELDFPAPVPERGIPAGAVVLLGVVLAVAAYGGWYKLSGSGRPESEPVLPVPPRLMPLAEAPAPPSVPARPAQTAATAVAADPGVADGNAAPAPTMPAQADAGSAMPAALPTVAPSQAAAAIPPAVMQGPAASPAASPVAQAASATKEATAAAVPALPAAPTGPRIVLRATADAWMQVRDAKGSVLLNRVLRSGETWPVPADGQYMLTTGNAGGTQILVDGQPTASLGGDGAVRRDMALDADAIRAGKLAAAKPAAKPQ